MVETVSGVINTASFLAKDYLDECIQHLVSERDLDREGLLGSLRTARDRIQMASMANALNEIDMVDVAARKVHAEIRTLCLQTAKAVLGQLDLGQLERLLTEIPVTADALFGCGLTNVIVQQAKQAKDWGKFFKPAEIASLKKITAVSSRTEGKSCSRPKKRGGSGFRRPDSTRRKDSSRRRNDQPSGSPPQKPFRRGGGGWPFRGRRGGGRGG